MSFRNFFRDKLTFSESSQL